MENVEKLAISGHFSLNPATRVVYNEKHCWHDFGLPFNALPGGKRDI
jgi:hypothetical protein